MFLHFFFDSYLLLQVKGTEDFQKQSDEDGSGLAVLPESFILVETIIPVVDLFVEVVFDEFCIFKFPIVDVDEFLEGLELVPIRSVLFLDDTDLVLLNIQLLLLARQLPLQPFQLLPIVLHL
jgi:hypothetical protein